MKIRIGIVDDQPIFRQGIQALLRQHTNHEHEIFTAEKLQVQGQGWPDIFLISLSEGNSGPSGFHVLAYLKKEKCRAKKIILTSKYNLLTILHFQEFGADLVLPVSVSPKKLLANLEKIESEGGSAIQEKPFTRLTKRERVILNLILSQFETPEIASTLNLSPLTIKTHRKNIFKKLGIRNLAGLVELLT